MVSLLVGNIYVFLTIRIFCIFIFVPSMLPGSIADYDTVHCSNTAWLLSHFAIGPAGILANE